MDDSGKKILGLSDKYVYGKIGSKDQADTSEDWNFYDGADGELTKRNNVLQSLTIATGSGGYPIVAPDEGAQLVDCRPNGDVIPFEKGYIVSYDIYGGTGQWANCTIGGGTLLWAVRIR